MKEFKGFIETIPTALKNLEPIHCITAITLAGLAGIIATSDKASSNTNEENHLSDSETPVS